MEWESSERQIEMKERILQLVREQQDQVLTSPRVLVHEQCCQEDTLASSRTAGSGTNF
jgi:GTP cyclohydrolase II